MSNVEIKTVEYNGNQMKVTADEKGNVWVGERNADKPVSQDGITFVFASSKDGLPSGAKIAFTQAQIDTIEQRAKAHKDAKREQARQEKAFNDKYNEGGEGFNPHAFA